MKNFDTLLNELNKYEKETGVVKGTIVKISF